MDSSTRIVSTAISYYLPLISILIIQAVVARELRPSDHGLEYQSPPPATSNKSPGMTSFFKGSSSASSPSSFSSSSDNVPLPKASNSSDTSWWIDGGRRDGGKGAGDHVKYVLLTASLVCGVTGVVLLIASGFIYLFRHKRTSSSPSSVDNNTMNNTK